MINQGTLVGRVGKIETKTVSTGTKISNISIVTSKRYTKNGQKEEKVTWHNVTAFQKLAEIAEKYVNVGDLLYIQGEMENQKYTDATGQERMKHFIIAHTIQMFPRSKEQPAAAPKGIVQDEAFVDDDLPGW
jgi:single-strand DNA-binding protein